MLEKKNNEQKIQKYQKPQLFFKVQYVSDLILTLT